MLPPCGHFFCNSYYKSGADGHFIFPRSVGLEVNDNCPPEVSRGDPQKRIQNWADVQGADFSRYL